jgi:glycerol uptake facilitator-like aquaporin
MDSTPDIHIPDLLEREAALEVAQDKLITKIDSYIEEQVYADKSPEAKAARRRAMVRAAYGEFICTFIFLFTVLGVVTHGHVANWSAEFSTVASALNAGFQAVAVCFAFSSVSGAHFNPSISFALWLTGKLSNRKVVLYIAVQLLASVCAMGAVIAIFHNSNSDIYDACVIKPPDDRYLGRVFATEFILTFVLTYVAFTIAFEDAESQKKDSMSIKGIQETRGLTIYASNPQSKTGFAPFVIGFTIFSLALISGSSGGAFNQARMFGPALVSGRWDYFYVYMFGEFCGSATAGLMVHNLHRFGLRQGKDRPVDRKLQEMVSPIVSKGINEI